LLCGSEGERAAGEAAGITARRWRVIPNAVDTDRFTPGDKREARGRLTLGERPVLEAIGDAPMVVCAGRLSTHQKGQDVLLAAWDAVVDAVPTAQLVFVGDGPDRAALEDLVRGLRASSSVWFAGGSLTTEEWFRASDVVAQPSRYETLSLSVLEALSVGRSVVVSDAVGMREAAGDDGAVVPRDDPAALASAIIERLLDPACAEAAARGRDRVIADHGLHQWADALLQLTVDVAGSR
jgi:glycosyltransferase involved in cell wall biosynthesis